jgi:hypothetical protein
VWRACGRPVFPRPATAGNAHRGGPRQLGDNFGRKQELFVTGAWRMERRSSCQRSRYRSACLVFTLVAMWYTFSQFSILYDAAIPWNVFAGMLACAPPALMVRMTWPKTG